MSIIRFLSVMKSSIIMADLPLFHYPHMIKLVVGRSKCKLQWCLAALDLFNKVEGVDSRIPPDAAEDRW